MKVTFAPNGYLQIDDARLIFRNFRGEGSKFNREGDRNFSLFIDDEDIANALMNDTNEYGVGWNVKIKPPREDGDTAFMHMPVKVRFNDRGPNVYLVTGGNMIRLDESNIDILDKIDIASADLDIRPYDDEFSGKPFRSAYLQSLRVVQDLSNDRFAARYADAE